MSSLIKLVCITSIIISTTALSVESTQFGETISMSNPVSLSKALLKSGNVLIKAKVGTVCKKKGCWMTIKDVQAKVRVTFEGYKFFVPFSLIGKNVLIQGKMNIKEMSLSETKHYIEDAGGDSSKVTKGRVEHRFVATGVKVINKI